MNPNATRGLCLAKEVVDMIIAKEGVNCSTPISVSPKVTAVQQPVISRAPATNIPIGPQQPVSFRALDSRIPVGTQQSESSRAPAIGPNSPVQTPLLPKPSINTIDINKLDYIASQHTGDCFWDTLQNIIMFADGYREVNAKFAIEAYNENPNMVLDTSPKFIMRIKNYYGISNGLFDIISKIRGKQEQDKDKFIEFLAKTFRRYILIKKQELEGARSRLRRLPSINGRAGINLKETGEGICLVYTQSEDVFYGLINNTRPIKGKFQTTHSYEQSNLKNLIAVQIGLYTTLKEDYGHALGIIRFKNDFYLIDDNIGNAIPIENIHKFTGNNFIMKYIDGYTEYYFGNDFIYRTFGRHGADDEIFTQQRQHRQVFIYKK
jgi:hypothetical protein